VACAKTRESRAQPWPVITTKNQKHSRSKLHSLLSSGSRGSSRDFLSGLCILGSGRADVIVRQSVSSLTSDPVPEMTATAAIDVPPRATLDYMDTLLVRVDPRTGRGIDTLPDPSISSVHIQETYAIASENYPLDVKDAIEVCMNVKVPGDGWRGYMFMAGVFYPKTDGGEGCDNFSRSMATRIRRALGLILEATSQNKGALSDAQADALHEKIYATLYPGGKLDVSSASEDEETGAGGAHIVEISSRRNGKKIETVYTVDFGRGDVREFTKYALKQTFADEWKNMLHGYNLASEKAMPTRMELKGRVRGRRMESRGAAANGRDDLLPGTTDMAGMEQAVDVAERAGPAGVDDTGDVDEVYETDEMGEMDGVEGMAGGLGSDGTSGQEFYRKADKPHQGSTMVDSTDDRKHFSGRRQVVVNRRDGHGGARIIQDAKHRDMNPKHRMSEPIPRSQGLVTRRDLQLERLPNTGPVRKRQRLSLNTPRTGLASLLDRTPLTGDGERGFLGTRTDTASLGMEFMSKVLQNEEILKAEVEDLLAQNKYLHGLLEDEELALNIADNELADVKRERHELVQLEELLRSREQELRSVKMSLRKVHSKNENALKDLTSEKEEWRALATQAQDQMDRQLEEHAANVQKIEKTAMEKASVVFKNHIQAIKKEISLERDKWGKDAALKLNEIELLRTAKTNLTDQLRASETKIKTLEADLNAARSDADALRKNHTMLSRRLQEEAAKTRKEANEQSTRAARVLANADKQLGEAMGMVDGWSKLPDGLMNVQRLLDFEDLTGERGKSLDEDAKRLFLRLRPSHWKQCKIKSCRHDKANSLVFIVEETKPGTTPGTPGSSSLFEVELEELKKREYCQRGMAEFFLQKIKPRAKSAVGKPQETKATDGPVISGGSYRTTSCRDGVSDGPTKDS
jgi:hypothetical protein